ncbi:cycloartenol synthase [Quercus suber]|uniref:Cycloartenol synthase n=1 Tax=Quercus suber TaxID=58331 RepID=A0AAW0M4L5_QUESU
MQLLSCFTVSVDACMGCFTNTVRKIYTTPIHWFRISSGDHYTMPMNLLREKALQTVMLHIHYEDENTRYICIGLVNKVLNMLCCWVEDPNSEAFKLHLPRIFDYLWIAEDGMKMQGYNGSQSWDTSFAIQTIISTNIAEEYGATLRKAHDYIKDSQVLEDCPGDLNFWYCHISKGAWPFSTADHGWSISDCTVEGLKAVLLLSTFPSETVGKSLDVKRLYDAVIVRYVAFLEAQICFSLNTDGGFATYELTRSYQWLECTSAAIQALTLFKKLYPEHMYGSWGVCFTYGGWFGIKGLVAAGRTYKNSFSIRKACNYLLSKELASGGWGESYLFLNRLREIQHLSTVQQGY